MKLGYISRGSTGNFSVEKPLSGLRIKCECDWGTVTDFSQRISKLRTEMNDVIITYSYVDKHGVKQRPCPRIPMSLISEIWQRNEGYIDITDSTFVCHIPFSSLGSMTFNNDQTLDIEISNNSGAQSLIDSIEVFTTHNPIDAGYFWDYTRISIKEGDKDKTIPVTEYDLIAIPFDKKFLTVTTEFRLVYSNAKDVEMFYDDLHLMGIGINDKCYQIDGLSSGGFGCWALIKVKEAVELELQRNSTTAFDIYGVTSKKVENFDEAIAPNAALVSTND